MKINLICYHNKENDSTKKGLKVNQIGEQHILQSLKICIKK